MAQVEEVSSVERLDTVLAEARSNLVVLHFSAKWSGECDQMNDVLRELAKDPHYVNVRFLVVEAEDLVELTEKYKVVNVPVFIFFKNKARIDTLEGVNALELCKKVKNLVEATVSMPSEESEEDINVKLQALVNQAPVMLFMKGSPDEPRCGFSRTIIGILNEHNIDYSHFNILSDENVRQGLKKFSDWPTYPQLYHKGELIGGLDIVKELSESKELQKMLPQKEDLKVKLKSLINKASVMLFMKGSPDTPRCGFSKTTIGILEEAGVPYETFDILQDESVRQGLKTYSDWPTYPQLYVNGELVGGLDIIKELKENNQLVDTLKGTS